MDRWRGKWSLVTGASAGIGYALAEQLAAGGSNLILTARRGDRLQQLARELHELRGIQAEVIAADLARPEAPEEIFHFVQGKSIPLQLLVNNAGFGAYGPFHAAALARQLEMVQVNCSAVIHLTRLFLPSMLERRSGDILIVASTAAFQAVPYIATYCATKAFDLLFAEALAYEVKNQGVRVCALCPGPTATEFRQVAGSPQRVMRSSETAEKVARVGLEALASGKSWVISGAANWLSTEAQRLAPRSLVTSVAAKLYRPPSEPG